MNTLPLVRANALLPMMRFLNQVGAPTQQFLLQTKLPSAVLDQPEALMSLYQTHNFIELAARSEGIELLSVLASQQLQIADIGLFGKVLSQSLTGYDLLQTIVALLTKTYSSGVRVWLTQDHERVWFNHQYLNTGNLGHQQFQYYACLLHLRVMRLIIGSQWYPTDLHFQAGKLQGLSQIDLFSGTRVRFNQPHNAIALPKSILYLPIKQRENVDQSDSPDLYERLRSSSPAINLVESLRQFLQFQLPSGHGQIEMAAESAGISVRTLQRRLALEGLSYSRLVDQVRFHLAVNRLKEPTMQLGDIAGELGYTKQGNFTRAFQRWSGVTPSEYRCLL